jgi:hypothetical protein
MKFTLAWKKLCNCSPTEITIFPISNTFDVYKNIQFSKTINSQELDSNPLVDRV